MIIACQSGIMHMFWNSSAEEDAAEIITKLIDKKYARYLDDEKGIRKVTNALARLGHDFSDIKEAIRNYIEEE